jgi:hypothetical protein
MHTALRRHIALFLAGLTFTLAACGGGSGSSTTATSSAGSSSTTNSGCTAGVVQVNGVTTRKFCGPAKATVIVGGQTFNLSGGECFNTSGLVGVNIGQVVLGETDAAKALKKQLTYLGIEVQASNDGTYPNAILSGYTSGVDFTGIGTLTLSNNLRAGAFSGKTILSKQDFTGTYTC